MTFYLLLGVRREATPDQIKRAYRRLARKYHPDINPGDERAAALFQQVSVAYEVLSDPTRRRRYDVEGDAPHAEVSASFQFQGFDFSAATSETGHASTFGDLFGDLLRRAPAAAAGGAPERGADLHVSVTLDFEDSVRGVKRPVTLTRLERCAPCGGLGRLQGPEVRCIHCDGLGHVRSVRGHMVFSRNCAACAGTGLVRYRSCAACGGEGVGVHVSSLTLELPAGTHDGMQLVMPAEGHAGRRGGAPGALHVSVRVQPHPFLRRIGNDILLEVPVAIHEAGLGTRIEVPTVDGKVKVRIPPGTQSGQVFRFRGRGALSSDGRRGDLVVTIRLVLPEVLDERSRELLREFGARNPESVRESWAVATSTLETADVERHGPDPRTHADETALPRIES